MSLLAEIVEQKRLEVASRKIAPRLANALPETRDFAGALRRPGLSVVAEIKRRSPSRGAIREGLDPAEVAHEYAAAGAAALSVLTESRWFGGSDGDLSQARDATPLPVLRKDFTIDAFQIEEARAIGADAVLLIARILSDEELRVLLSTARSSELAALVEVHDERELDRATAAGAAIIGINSRDLDTLRIDLAVALRLRERLPSGFITVAESGIHTGDDVRRVVDAGFDGMLVGESLLRADRPGEKLRELLEAAR